MSKSWQGLRAWQRQSAIHTHWSWSNIWQIKVCRILFLWEHGLSLAGLTLKFIWMWYREVGSTQVTSSCMGKEALQRKTCLLAFWWDGNKRINSVYERLEKHHPLPRSPFWQDCLGKEKWCLAGCTAGCSFGKILLSFECLLPGQGEQILGQDCCKQLGQSCCLSMTSLHLAPVPQYSPVLSLHCLSSCREIQSGIYQWFQQSQELILYIQNESLLCFVRKGLFLDFFFFFAMV